VSSGTDLSKTRVSCVGATANTAPSAGSLETSVLCADTGLANRSTLAADVTKSRRVRRGMIGRFDVRVAEDLDNYTM
jgi:hypothetical protein